MSTKISILLPTRGRTATLERSLFSLIELADDPAGIQYLLGFDNDDPESLEYFQEHIQPKIQDSGARYTVLEFEPLGYSRLNDYVNTLASIATGDWFVFWNDDAVMRSPGWDTVINSYTGRFCIQAFDTHNLHPYSIFPIVPREWFEQLGYLSKHQLNDAWISQIAWMLDIMQRIDVKVDHERYDLTGANQDATFKNRKMFEGNMNDPRDINHWSQRQLRVQVVMQLAEYLRERGYNLEHWDKVEATQGNYNVWQKMIDSDINNQLTIHKDFVKQ